MDVLVRLSRPNTPLSSLPACTASSISVLVQLEHLRTTVQRQHIPRRPPRLHFLLLLRRIRHRLAIPNQNRFRWNSTMSNGSQGRSPEKPEPRPRLQCMESLKFRKSKLCSYCSRLLFLVPDSRCLDTRRANYRSWELLACTFPSLHCRHSSSCPRYRLSHLKAPKLPNRLKLLSRHRKYPSAQVCGIRTCLHRRLSVFLS